jgi:4-amino-4-deoxy-L-arabinose transferase-like glycosyltransferase
MRRSPLIKIFLAALLVRVLYALAAPAIFYFNADSIGYYTLGTAFFTHPSLLTLFTPYRSPVYPLFLNAVMYVLGVGGTPFGSAAFLWGMQVVVGIQMIIGAIAFTAFYQVIARILSKRAGVLFGVFLLLDVLVIGWERTLLTEGLAISVSLGMTAVLLHLILAPTGKKFTLFWLLFAFGFLLRPSFVAYPIATLPLVAWYMKKNARVVFLACLTLAASLSIPLAYARANYVQYNYFGIQFVSDIDELGRILQFNIPVESAKNNTYFYSIVKDSRAGNPITPTGFELLFRYDPNIWGKTYRFVELQAFNRAVLFTNLPLYVGKAVSTVPEILLEVCGFTLVPPASTNLLTNIVWRLQQAYGVAQYATLAIPLLWFVMGSVFFIQPSRWNAIVAAVGTIAMSQIVLTALVVYKDIGGQYGRVLSIVQPHMFLFLLLCAVSFSRMYRKRRI